MQLMIDTDNLRDDDAIMAARLLASRVGMRLVMNDLEDPTASGAAAVNLPPVVAQVALPVVEALPPAAVVFAVPAALNGPNNPAAPSVGFVPPPVPSAPAAAAPAAPTATLPGTSPAAAAVSPSDLDKNGFPWDARIHSDTKGKNKDGSWRNRRNLDKLVLATVEAELKMLHGVRPVFTEQAPVIPAPPVPAGIPAPPAATVTLPVPAPPGIPAPVLPGAPTFATVMTKITSAMHAQKLTKPQVDEALAATFGVGATLQVMAGASVEQLTAMETYLARWGV